MTTTAQDTTPPLSSLPTPLAENAEPPEPPRRVSVVERFLEVRGIERKKPSSAPIEPSIPTAAARPGRPIAVTATAATLARVPPPRAMWHAYTKRRHGERTQFARAAMRVPDDSYADSTDVYNPKKRAATFIKVHEHADEVDCDFLYRARRLLFEREVVDRPVCDLEENQAWYDTALDREYDEDQGNDEQEGHRGGADVDPTPASDAPS